MARENSNAVTELTASERLSLAIDDFIQVLGAAHVLTGVGELQQYAKCCELREVLARAVLRPGSVAEVSAILAIAKIHSTRLYTISTGKNWGYGSASPTAEDLVVVDLGRLNQIVEVNKSLAYAIVEPGVTQQQLYDYLQERKLELVFDVTGATPDASIIGNLLERGYGYTTNADHFLNSGYLEVVLPDGTIVKTGLAHFENARAKYICKHGIGPALDGIFTQSNFGIITKACVWLMPRPEYYGAYVVSVAESADVGKALELLRDLKLSGLITGAPHLLNEVRSASLFATRAEFTHDTKAQKVETGSAWTAVGGIWGNRSVVDLKVDILRNIFAPIGKVEFVSQDAFEHRDSDASAGLSVEQQRINLVLSLTGGIPTTKPLAGMYWAKSQLPKDNSYAPLADDCGLLWFAPLVPLLAADIRDALEIARNVCAEYSIDTNVAFALVSDRAATMTIAIPFDRAQQREIDNAGSCYRSLAKRMIEGGFYPYRFGNDISLAPPVLFDRQDPFWKLCRTLKETLDPDLILSPGKYSLG